MIAQFSLVYDDAGLEVVAGRGPGASFAQASLDRGVVVDGVVKRPKEFIATLRRTLRESSPRPITARHVVVGLPETRVFTTLVQLPQVRDRELKGALTWQLPNLLPAPPDELVVDFQPISAQRHGQRQLLVIAAPLAVVSPLVETLEQAGFVIDRCVPRSLGIASLFAKPAHTPLMVVDHEATDAVSLMIVKNGTARFSTTVPLEKKPGRVSTAIERAIEFYEARDGQHRHVERVLVLPHPNADELISQLRAELKLPVQLAETPWIQTHAPRRLRAFLGSVGLFNLHGVRVNLVPPKTLAERANQKRRWWLRLVWASQLVAMLLVLTAFGSTIARALTQTRLHQATLAAIPTADDRLVAQGQSLTTLAGLHQTKQGLRSTRYHDYDAFQAAAHDGVRLVIVEHDTVKRETHVIGERDDRAALARYVTALGRTFPELTLAPGDWTTIETAPFHLTVKRP